MVVEMRELNVAISLHISNKSGSSIWSNGAVQHTIFLYQLFKKIPYVKNVWLGTYDAPEIQDKWLLGEIKDDIVPMDSVIENVDLFVEMARFATKADVKKVREKDGRIISYKFGNDYSMTVESLSFAAHPEWIPNPQNLKVDAVWTNLQHLNTCKSYFEHLYHAKVVCVPHLWSPYFLEKDLQSNPKAQKGWPYQPLGDEYKISIFEPNINVLKTTLVPFLISSAFYDSNKESLKNILMYNGSKIKDNKAFKRIVLETAAGKDRVASVEHRTSFGNAMGKNGGIVVSHQWENGLNYLYYEALYGGFPLVHNSPFLKDVGYYYEGFDIDDGVRALEKAVFEHDENLELYRDKADAFLTTVDPADERVVDEYDRATRQLFQIELDAS